MKILSQKIKVLRSYLRYLKNKFFNPLHRFQNINIGGKNLQVYHGTFTKLDKDDAWLASLMEDSKVIFDVGANIGWTALLANVYGNPKHIVLIDPNALALTYAAGNLIMNDFAINATIVRAFASNREKEEVKFFTVDVGAAGSMYSNHAKTARDLNSWFFASTVTLDKLSERLNIVPDFIKIDVEGAERLVLQGASKLCLLNEIKVFVEMHSNQELTMASNAEYILNWCKEKNYKAWYLTNGEELMTPEQISSRGRCHLLLLPINQDYPSKLRDIKQGDTLPSLI
jgi:FkbM family methyltransferase